MDRGPNLAQIPCHRADDTVLEITWHPGPSSLYRYQQIKKKEKCGMAAGAFSDQGRGYGSVC